MNPCINDYIKSQYGPSAEITSFEDKNYCFDIFVHDKNINFSVEYKERFFESGKNEKFLHEYDVLVELIQSTPYLQKIDIKNINSSKAHNINIAVGWFYKCDAKRLIFFRYLDKEIFDVIDIDFPLFKSWVMNNVDNFKLSYSSKTTGTINAVVKLKDIPKAFLNYIKIKPV